MATTSLEDVAKASKGSPLIIFQLYVQRDRDFTASLIRSKTHFVVHKYNVAAADSSLKCILTQPGDFELRFCPLVSCKSCRYHVHPTQHC